MEVSSMAMTYHQPLKRTIDEVREKLKENGYELLSTEYHDNKEKLKMKHLECGYEFEMRYNSFASSGQRCPRCANKLRGKHPRHALLKNRANADEKNKEILERCGDEFEIIKGYTTYREALEIKCKKCNTIFKPHFYNFIYHKTGCPNCSPTKSRPYSTENYKQKVSQMSNDEYEFRDTYTTNHEKKLFYHKLCGNEFLMKPNNFNDGNRCPMCANSKIKEALKYTKDDFQEVLNIKFNNEYTIISEYNGTKNNITLKHLKCNNVFTDKASYIRSNLIPCPICRAKETSSSEERDVRTFIDSLNLLTEHKKFEKKEIDMFIKDKNIGFEYDGLYWHSDKFRNSNYHIEKTKFFDNKGIRIVHIFSDEWLNKQEIVKDKIQSILGIQKEKIYARKCEIKEIPSKERNIFLEKNHIQGADKASISYGLLYKNELVAILSLSKPRIALGQKPNNNSGLYELSRFAGKLGFTIVGGFSKLLKNILKLHPEIKKIITYADIRWTDLHNNVSLL